MLPRVCPSPFPVPVSASAAVATFFFPAAVKVAVTVPELAGVNRTVTVHVFPDARLRQVSPVMVNAAEPVSVTCSLPLP
jgi:hypothetical protein